LDKATLEIIRTKANRGTWLQLRIEALKKLREGLNNCEITVSIGYKNAIGFYENNYISKHTNDELLEPVKESIIDIVDNQIKMYEIEFAEL